MAFAIASNPIVALFKKKAPAPKKAPAKKGLKGKAPVRRTAGVKREGNVGPNRTLWNGWEANPEPPAYLDGTLPGDAGFDPFGLSKPTEYLQFGLDSLDGSAAINPYGRVIGKLKKVDNKPTERTIVVSVFSGIKSEIARPFLPRGADPRAVGFARRDRRRCLRVTDIQNAGEFDADRAAGPVVGRVSASRFSIAIVTRGRSRTPSAARLFSAAPELSPLIASRPRASADLSSPPLLPSQPFNEAFDIVRFRECELQHSRWAMLGLVGAVVAEGQTGISWVDAGKVLNEQPSYLGFDINVPVTTLVVIETLSMGFAEIKRSSGAYPPRVSSQRTLPGRRATLPNNAVFFIHPRRRRQYFHDVTMMIDCPTDRIILPRSS